MIGEEVHMRPVVRCVVLALGFTLPTLALAQDAKVQQGMKVYDAQKCSLCHSVAGKGNKMNPLDGTGKKLSEAEIKEWIVTPAEAAKKANSTKKPAMKAYPNLPASDLDALVAYVHSL
jgi:mono/diheme cytochrome c family protein